MFYTELYDDLQPGHKEPKKTHFLTLWKKINVECSDIIKIINDTQKFLLRGVNFDSIQKSIDKENPLGKAFLGKPRENRLSLSGDPEEQEFTNAGLKILGFKTNRSNSIAVSSDYMTAKTYGTVYLIFPKNGFSFLTGNRRDLLSLINKTRVVDWLLAYYPDIKIDGKSIVHAHSYNVAFTYKILNYVKSNDELMKEYWTYSEKQYNLTDSDIIPSLDRGYEIMISNCEYYALEYRTASRRLVDMGYNL